MRDYLILRKPRMHELALLQEMCKVLMGFTVVYFDDENTAETRIYKDGKLHIVIRLSFSPFSLDSSVLTLDYIAKHEEEYTEFLGGDFWTHISSMKNIDEIHAIRCADYDDFLGKMSAFYRRIERPEFINYIKIQREVFEPILS